MKLSFKIAAAAIVFNTMIAAAFATAPFVVVATIVMLGSVLALRYLEDSQSLPEPINVGEVKPVEEKVEPAKKRTFVKRDEGTATTADTDKPKKPRKRNYNRKPKNWAVENQ